MTTGDFLAKLRHAIKQPHTSIHRLNLSRIPLCLPPYTDRPSLYSLGLSRYAELFYGIENAWLSLIGDPVDWMSLDTEADVENQISSPEENHDPFPCINAEKRIQTVLRMLYIPELLRTRALQNDIRFLTALHPPSDPVLIHSNNDHDRDSGRRVGQELRYRVRDRPHILVAYVWIIYSALLYGGRDIRSLLLKAGPDFWGLSVAEMTSHQRLPCPLSFWHIDDDAEVKAKFRVRMTDAERLLSAREQDDVLDEAIRIFQTLEELTRSLDEDAECVASCG
ncbi:hypothetical protein F1880_004962 [Penicillium rolfsii]|nr:hypothetical protein F1880_004962 [Penicillium rolfsii]